MPFRVMRKKRIVKKKFNKPVTKSLVNKLIEKNVFGHGKGDKVYKFKRNLYYSTITSSVSLAQSGGFQFLLQDMPNYSEFLALYDEYKIDKVVLHFICQSPRPATAANFNPFFMYVIDHDDSNTPAAYTDLQQYETCKTIKADHSFYVSIVPRAAQALYKGAFTGYGTRVGWVDMTSTDVQHYGLKYWMPVTNTAGDGKYQVFATYHFSCRGVR